MPAVEHAICFCPNKKYYICHWLTAGSRWFAGIAFNNLMQMYRFLFVFSFITLLSVGSHAKLTFTQIDASDGLSDNQVQHILQLRDGRMAITTKGNINLYDGMQFRYIHRNDSDVYRLDDYYGAYHVYVDENDLLWVKDWNSVWAFDLRKECYLRHPEIFFRSLGLKDKVTDLFVDSQKTLWLVTSRGVWDSRNKRYIHLPGEVGTLQDVETMADSLYLFFSTGEVFCYEGGREKMLYRSRAYSAERQNPYAATSLVVKGPDYKFYQVRTGRDGSACFVFDTRTRVWKQLLAVSYNLHTLIVPSGNHAYISCKHGILELDLTRGEAQLTSALHTVDGALLTTKINTIFQDRQRGIWLGTYDQGLLYAHPQHFSFTSASLPDAFGLSDSLLNGISAKGTQSFRGRTYNDVFTDSRGWTWLATSDGLRLHCSGTGHHYTFYTENGLANNCIHAIAEDTRHRMWFFTSNGISTTTPGHSPDSLRFINYFHLDGTLKGEYLNGTARLLDDGRLIAGGVGGWTLFHPDSVRIPVANFRPLLVGMALHGKSVPVTADNPASLLPNSLSYVTTFELPYYNNTISLDFSALNYAWPQHTCWRYRMIHDGDSVWHTVGARSSDSRIDRNGNLHLSFSMLPPDTYRLQVMASTHPDHWTGEVTELYINVLAPWWLTGTAYTFYMIVLCLSILFGIRLYVRISRRNLLRKHKEEILLMRIRHLIERCDNYERKVQEEAESSLIRHESPISSADNDFLNRAVALVESNLNTPGYSVEQLSKDLCMERTGLYKKLTGLLDKSPSLFIRSIRLKRAATLIRQGKMSISEIAEQVGFSSASYMAKCFQEEFGCKPSEYTRQLQADENPG